MNGSENVSIVVRLKLSTMNTDLVTNWFTEDGELLSAVKLFKKSLTPEYLVVGRLNEETYAFYQGVGRKQ